MSVLSSSLLRRASGGLILGLSALLLLVGPRPAGPVVALAACSMLVLGAWSLREARQGRRRDGLRTLLDALLLGLALSTLLALAAPGVGPAVALLFALCAAAAVSPWVGGCSRGAGADPRTLVATAGLSLFLIGGWSVVVAPDGRTSMTAAAVLLGVAIVIRRLLAGELDALLLVGSPVQQRRCGRARLAMTAVLPAGVAAAALAASWWRGPSPSLSACVAGLAMLAIVRGRWVPPVEPRPAEPPDSAARLVALGELARLAAHEIRNSLSVLFSSADLLRRDRSEDERRELLDALNEEGERIRVVVDQLTELAREETGPREVLRLAQLVRQAARRAVDRPGWPEGVTVGLQAFGDSDVVFGDATQLEIAVSHVLQAAARGGARSVRADRPDPGPEGAVTLRIRSDGHAPPPDWAGAPSRLLAEAASADGALGLAVARRVAREHGGELTVERPPEGGFLAELSLPHRERA